MNLKRVLKCLVSGAEKRFSIASCSQVRALFIQSGPFLIQSRPISSSPDLFKTQSDLFSSSPGLFMLNGALFQIERPPSPQCLARLQ